MWGVAIHNHAIPYLPLHRQGAAAVGVNMPGLTAAIHAVGVLGHTAATGAIFHNTAVGDTHPRGGTGLIIIDLARRARLITLRPAHFARIRNIARVQESRHTAAEIIEQFSAVMLALTAVNTPVPVIDESLPGRAERAVATSDIASAVFHTASVSAPFRVFLIPVIAVFVKVATDCLTVHFKHTPPQSGVIGAGRTLPFTRKASAACPRINFRRCAVATKVHIIRIYGPPAIIRIVANPGSLIQEALCGVVVACHPAPTLRVPDYISPAELIANTFIAIAPIAMPEPVSATTGDIRLAGL